MFKPSRICTFFKIFTKWTKEAPRLYFTRIASAALPSLGPSCFGGKRYKSFPEYLTFLGALRVGPRWPRADCLRRPAKVGKSPTALDSRTSYVISLHFSQRAIAAKTLTSSPAWTALALFSTSRVSGLFPLDRSQLGYLVWGYSVVNK